MKHIDEQLKIFPDCKLVKEYESKSNNISSNRTGDLAEYYAVTWLWDQGYEVFPNAGCDGMVDMIAWKPFTGKLILIDVKTEGDQSKGHGSHSRTKEQIDNNIQILYYNPRTRKLKFPRHRE